MTIQEKINNVQEALLSANLDGWLFADFRGSDSIAYSFLGLDPTKFTSRRWFYFIPKSGLARKLCNKIEPHSLDSLPGEKQLYMPWATLEDSIKWLLGNGKNIAAQYSKNNEIPYISKLDAGMYELITSLGYQIHSSGDLISTFEAHLTEEQFVTHQKAGELMMKVKDDAFSEIGRRIKSNESCTEFEIFNFIQSKFTEYGLWTDHGPIVGVNEHAADPHFEPTEANSYQMKKGDLVLIDIFAKLDLPNAVWYDVTWMGYIGNQPSQRIIDVHKVNCKARNASLELVKERFSNNLPIYGYEVDDAARNVIKQAGLDQYFIHRTGHNISTALHGNGAHCDNFETHDTRKIINGSCFSIEPGIYIPEEKIGFRNEIDVFIHNNGTVEVVGGIQEDLILINVD